MSTNLKPIDCVGLKFFFFSMLSDFDCSDQDYERIQSIQICTSSSVYGIFVYEDILQAVQRKLPKNGKFASTTILAELVIQFRVFWY